MQSLVFLAPTSTTFYHCGWLADFPASPRGPDVLDLGPSLDETLLPEARSLLVGAAPFDVDLHAEHLYKVPPLRYHVPHARNLAAALWRYVPAAPDDTHESKTDPEAGLYRKGNGQEAKLGYLGHVLMENRHGLIVNAMLT